MKRASIEITLLFPVDPERLGSVVSVGRVKGNGLGLTPFMTPQSKQEDGFEKGSDPHGYMY